MLSAANLAGYLQGMVRQVRRLPRALRAAHRAADGADARPADFAAGEFTPEAAVRFLKAKDVLTADRFAALKAGYKRHAFTLAGVDSERLVGEVRDRLAAAVEQGQTVEQFRKAVDAAFDAAGVTRRNPYHLEAVFRTNVLSAYGAGQWDLLHDPAVVGLFPLYRYHTVGDERVRDEHRALEGVTRPANDAFWATHWPPLGFQCRCWVEALDQEAAAGVEATPAEKVPRVPATPGFGIGGGAERQWGAVEEAAGGKERAPLRTVSALPPGEALFPGFEGDPAGNRADAGRFLESLRRAGPRPDVRFGIDLPEERWALLDARRDELRRHIEELHSMLTPESRADLGPILVSVSEGLTPRRVGQVIEATAGALRAGGDELRRQVFHETLHIVGDQRAVRKQVLAIWRERSGAAPIVTRVAGGQTIHLQGPDAWMLDRAALVKGEPGERPTPAREILPVYGEFLRSPLALQEMCRHDPIMARLLVKILGG